MSQVYGYQRNFNHFKIATNEERYCISTEIIFCITVQLSIVSMTIHIHTLLFQYDDMLMGLIHLKVAQTHCFVFIENVLNISWWVLYSVSDMLIASYSPWRFQSWIYILFRVYQRKRTIGVWERKTTNIFNMAELFKTPLYTKGSEN